MIRLPVVLTEPSRATACPSCGSGLIRHQTTVRGLTDLRIGAVTVQRYKCKGFSLNASA